MANETIVLERRIEIEEPLQDVVADEYTCVIFECRISECSNNTTFKWYKDGKNIETSSKVKTINSEQWYRIELQSVSAQDHGVYVILLKNDTTETFSKANLYVRPVSDRCNNIYNEAIYMNPTREYIYVEKHLRNAKILVGNTIELEAEFSGNCSDDYLWYKSNCPLVPNERTIVLSDKRTTTLSILCAKETDSGIYHVVSKSENGVASSFATIVVINTDISALNTSELVPSIEEALVDEIEVNDQEELRLLCKSSYDVNTCIEWSKNKKCIGDMEKMVTEYYNNSYICLRIKNTCVNDSGEYTLSMRDEITGHVDSSSCFVTVNAFSRDRNSTKLLKPLEPIVTCFGTTISLSCSFAMDDPRFYYVVWYIGHFRVERTNHRFHVLQSGGDFFLIIMQVDPGMAGSVTCELRKSLPNRKSLLVNTTTTYLTIVPPDILHNEITTRKTKFKGVFDNTNSKIEISLKNKELNGNSKCMVSSNGAANNTEHKTIMIITYCRLNEDHFYLGIDNDRNEILATHIVVNEKSTYLKPSNESSKLVVIQWYDNQVIDSNMNNNWHIIEYGKTTSSFVQAGVSSLPLLEIKDPPIDQIMRFRISTTECPNSCDESRVCILPYINNQPISTEVCNLKPMEEFDTMFTKSDVIGCGAFGSVVLVQDNKERYFAAKILKTRTQKKRDTAMREYEMMRTLCHPKLVQLYYTYSSRDSFILVMDYLWGGELFDRIVEEEHIKEVDVVPYVRQICEALLYLHEQKIAHLDLKPENIICLSPNSRLVKIIDFGLARVLEEGHVTRAIYGTRDYVAPEVLNFERLTLACDMWSLGVVTYMLLSGVMPFSGESWPERSANITMANYDYHESAFKEISDLAKDFVDRLLVLQPERRMAAKVALNHTWILEGPPGGARAGHMKRARENLKSYLANHRARWQRAGNVMIAAHRLRTNAALLRNNTADTDGPKVT